jgi:hypothetical protein
MADGNGKKDRKLSVETLYNVFSMLENEKALRPFLDECESRGLSLKVSAELYALGKEALNKLPGLEAAGPDCPACPPSDH